MLCYGVLNISYFVCALITSLRQKLNAVRVHLELTQFFIVIRIGCEVLAVNFTQFLATWRNIWQI